MEIRGQENVATSKKESSASNMLPTNFCHGQASQNGRCKDHSADKVGLKCPMNSNQTNSTIKSIPDTESKESGSAKSMVLGRRFNDTPAIVPIKKRRIQIVEAMRSPSPSPSSPPRSPSPQTFSSHRLASALYTCSPSRQSSSHCMVPSPTPSSPNSFSIGKDQNCLASNKIEKFLGQEEEQEKQGITRIEDYQSVIDSGARGLLESYCEDTNKISSQIVRQNIEDLSPERAHDEIARSESGSIGRDDRLHWDLNTDMAAWDTVSDQDGGKNIDCEGAESPDTSTSRASDDSSHGERRMHRVNDDMEERDQEARQTVDHNKALVENCSSMKQKTSLLTRQTGWESDNMVYNNMRYGSSESTSDLGEIHDKLEVKDHEKDIAKRVLSEPKKQLKSDDGKDDIDGRGFLEFEKQIKSNDYEDDIIKRRLSESEKQIISDDVKNNTIEIGISESEKEIKSDDAKDNSIEKGISESKKNIKADDGKEDIVERSLLKSKKHIKSYDAEDDILESGLSESKKHIRSDGVKDDIIEKDISESEKQIKSEGAGDWNMSEEPEGEEHVDYGDSDFRDVDDIGLGIDDKTDSMMQTEGYSNSELGKHGLHIGDTRSDRDETQSRASSHEDGVRYENQGKLITSGRRRPTGWDQLPEGFDNPEEALKAAKEMAPRRGGRSTTWIASGGRGSNGSNRVGATPRDGYSAGRIDSGYYGERRSDDNMTDRENFNRGRRSDDGFSAHNAAVARGRNLGRREGMFGGRGRGSGWVEGQGSSINQWGRQRTSAAFGGPTGMAPARVGSGGGFILAHDGTTIPKPGSGIISGGRGGMRPLVNRGGRGPLLQIGRGSPMDMDVGMHYSMRAGNRPNGMTGGGRGLGVIHDPRNGSSSGRGLVDRYRSISGGPPPQQSRRSESPRRSSSSSSSHRMDHHHHHYPNVSNRMPSMRSESRIVKSRTSPSEYIPTRSQQRSPPPSSRWSMDKREGDGQRERDIRRSSVSRLHAPPQRTSPHVVHGSSLMDERDRQVLAVTRHSPSPLLKSAPEGSSLEARQQPPRRCEEGDEEEEPPQHFRSQSKEVEDRASPRDDKDRYKGYFSYRRDRERDRDMTDIEDRRRDPHKMLNKDERLVSGEKHAIGRDTDDDVAPRRRRHS